MHYSILLLYPDYIADRYGQETYYSWQTADSLAEAVHEARQAVINNLGGIGMHEDFYVLLALEGKHISYDDGTGGVIDPSELSNIEDEKDEMRKLLNICHDHMLMDPTGRGPASRAFHMVTKFLDKESSNDNENT